MLLVAVFLTVSFSASAQIFVEIRPKAPVIVKPPQPGPGYMWVNEDWEPYGKTYRYTGGHWARSPYSGSYWRPGYWVGNKQGQKWVKGSWYNKQTVNINKSKGQINKPKGESKKKH